MISRIRTDVPVSLSPSAPGQTAADGRGTVLPLYEAALEQRGRCHLVNPTRLTPICLPSSHQFMMMLADPHQVMQDL
jgi:hypothetical protein